ncbi:unnamed protein product [Trifolium pratense]|uniref:Uncharacterized protein n=1 Tax=Trifolium pratense TaxID=57577 RepID=A0ACB0JSX7_TRIPR|nr:unnamed protein product [Trifolium pratense]
MENKMENKVSTIEKIIELKAKVDRFEKLVKLNKTNTTRSKICVAIYRENEKEEKLPSPPLSTTLVFTIMSIVGGPVTVHVKDGSVYSGIFLCANHVEGHFSIVLKQAIITQKGKHHNNVGKEARVDSIQIPSYNLLKVVAKAMVLIWNEHKEAIIHEDYSDNE